MGSTDSGRRRDAFDNKLYPWGIDWSRSDFSTAGKAGDWKANASTTFYEGSPVMLNSSREAVIANQTGCLGVAARGCASHNKAAVIAESVTFGTSDATKSLAHANLVEASVKVRSVAAMTGGTTYTVTTDYTVNATNGTLTHVESGGGITEASPVYVSYTWNLTAADEALAGTNYFGTQNDVTMWDGRIAIFTGNFDLYTTEFETIDAYELSGAGSNLYVSSAGLFNITTTSSKLVGHVISVPTADDPYLGMHFHNTVTANT